MLRSNPGVSPTWSRRSVRGGATWQRAVWGTPGIIPLLWYSALGVPAARWFIKVDPGALDRRSRLRWAIRVLGWTSRVARVRLPSPEYAPVDDPRRILEEVLPARFGGGPRDYQLVEEHAGDGQPRLRLLMHPAIGPADPAAVASAFLAAMEAGAEHRRHMTAEWRVAGLLRVEREAPRASASGKILHLMAAPPEREGGM